MWLQAKITNVFYLNKLDAGPAIKKPRKFHLCFTCCLFGFLAEGCPSGDGVARASRRLLQCETTATRTVVCKETISGSLDSVLDRLKTNPVKGEIVIVIAPPTESAPQDIDLNTLLTEELKHCSLKEAVKKISETYKLKRNDVYEKALQIKNQSL